MQHVQVGTVILIVGTSSVGKSSTVRALQDLLSEHYHAIGIDTFFHMVAPRWGGGMGGPLSKEGFRYVTTSDEGAPIIRITYGPIGWRILRGMHRTVATLARCSNNVIVDEMLLDSSILDDWAEALYGLPVCLIRLHAELSVHEQREQQRGNPIGLARGHLHDNEVAVSDLVIDTTTDTPNSIAQTIMLYLASDTEWLALHQLPAKK